MSLKKIITKALTVSTLSLIAALSANAQTAISQKERAALDELMKHDTIQFKTDEDTRRIATKFDFGQMELALNQNKYDTFFDYVSQVKSDDSLVKFLESKIHQGHIPVYWILADINSKRRTGLEAHKWLYIATIATEQDVVLCGDRNLDGKTKEILRSFPETIHYTRGTPYYINDSMKRTYEFLANLKERQSPNWICAMSTAKDKEKNKGKKRARPVHRSKWETTRMKVLEDYAGQYKPQITSGDIFRELEEKERMEREIERIEQEKLKK